MCDPVLIASAAAQGVGAMMCKAKQPIEEMKREKRI